MKVENLFLYFLADENDAAGVPLPTSGTPMAPTDALFKHETKVRPCQLVRDANGSLAWRLFCHGTSTIRRITVPPTVSTWCGAYDALTPSLA